MLHDGGDIRGVAIGEGVDIELDRVLEERIHEEAASLPCRLCELVWAVTNTHVPAAEHVRGTYEHRVADALRDDARFIGTGCHPPRRDRNAEPVAQPGKAVSVLCEIDCV